MKLVIGGAFQGKREAACRMFGYEISDFLDGRNCALSDIASCRAVAYFHEYIRRCMRLCGELSQLPWQKENTENVQHRDGAPEQGADGVRGFDADTFASWLIRVNPGLLIVSDEIGCGVVPVGREERAWRETTGRICCRLAEYSDTVVRVLAGIPTVIKQTGAPV